MGQLEDMDTFVRIIDAGSISQAAHQLGLVKSAVSRRLSDLELRLGVQLLTRTTRQSSLTEAGQHYYRKSLRILADVAEINATTSKARNRLAGVLKISAPLSFGLLHLAPAINIFADRHPDLIIHMDFNDRQVDLIEDGFDIAIRIANLGDSSLVARKLAPIRRILCASPGYLAHRKPPQRPNDLKDHQLLHYANARNCIWHFTGPGGRHHAVSFGARMIANNGDFLKQAALDDHGILLSPTFIVWKEIAAGTLISLMDNYPCSGLNAYAVYPRTRHLPYRVRVLIDYLTAVFGGEPYWDKAINNNAAGDNVI